MKSNLLMIILALVVIGLFIALAVTKKQAAGLHDQNAAALLELSNQLGHVSANLEGLRQDSQSLSNQLAAATQTFAAATNHLAMASNELAGLKGDLSFYQTNLTGLNGRAGGLTPVNQELHERTAASSNKVSELTGQLAGLNYHFNALDATNTVLARQLQKLTEQKRSLQDDFHDQAVLRAREHRLFFRDFY